MNVHTRRFFNRRDKLHKVSQCFSIKVYWCIMEVVLFFSCVETTGKNMLSYVKQKKNRDNVIQRDRISHCPNEYGRKEERIRQGR